MKKISKKVAKKVTKKNGAKKPARVMKKAAKVEESLVHNTRGAEMPDPAARNRPLRKDVRFAYR